VDVFMRIVAVSIILKLNTFSQLVVNLDYYNNNGYLKISKNIFTFRSNTRNEITGFLEIKIKCNIQPKN